MQFKTLRLVGFKSFVEPTELQIENGLTGVVGPNGCGKSNLVEALRWVMGENSAKKMRGGAMDDVIFAGTAARPSRNQAEVSIFLENSEGKAPAPFTGETELNISRGIRREAGSTYRVNSREVRARDVQLLFADLSTGAHSTAIVSQGRVGTIINAKPTDRRSLLEEAAGITGLHSRRHEAELRLRGAEGNLERLDDVTAQLEAQLQSLKRQARQATRYRNISGHIRRAEATSLYLQHRQAAGALALADGEFRAATGRVADLTALSSAADRTREEAAAGLPERRQREAEASAAAHRLVVARESLDAEEARTAEMLAQVEARLIQVRADLEREFGQRQEAQEAGARLDTEQSQLTAAGAGHGEAEAAALSRVEQAETELNALQATLDAATERLTALALQRADLDQRIAGLANRIPVLRQRQEKVDAEKSRLQAKAESLTAPTEAEAALDKVRQAAAAATEAAELAERHRLTSQGAEAEAREHLRLAHDATAKLEAETKALAAMVESHDDDLWPPLIDAVHVTSGYEAALGAALGDDLTLPEDDAAPAHWSAYPPYDECPALPGGVPALAEFVTGPAVLERRLRQIGLVDEVAAPALARQLAQGQRLVSASGGLWRWDGVTVKPGAATAAAIRLEQRNRLAEARKELRRDQALLGQAQDTFAKIQAALAQASETERQARRASRTAESELNAARDRHATLIRHWTERASRLEALDDSTGQVAADMAEAEAALEEAEAARQGLADPAGLQSELAGQRQAVDEARSTLIGAKSQLEHIRQSEAERRQRLQSIAQDKARWQGRAVSADGQISQLQDRQANAEREAAGLAEKPADIAERRRALLSKLSTVEADQRAAADALQEAETALHNAEETAKLASAALQAAREDKVRLEGQVDLCRQRLADVVERTMETLQCRPEEASEAAGIDPDGDLPDLEKVDLKLERLRRERDNMGPVNLRADIEATEVREKVETLASEREDLEAAIARLRQGIASLNREGRERLLAAFKQVDQHFQTLFVRVFGGGRAHLALTESEDPLEAGLEIMASPPGKRLQVMSLLSGGEQALTALALLFAVFLTRPAPICILDEVDAPLDDANVDRLCNLLDEIRATSNTRFLVVTHNPITMARMDRLFGVTMAERGVSQLVSVDLGQAEALRESA